MSKTLNFLFCLTFILILLPSANSGGRGGRGGRGRRTGHRGSTSSGDGSRGVGSSAVGESSAGSSSSANEAQNQIPLVKEVLKDIADIRDYMDCFRLINYVTEHPEDYHNIEQNKEFLEELLKKKGESKKQIKVIMNKMVSDEATRAEIKKYCNEEGEKIYNEIPEKSTSNIDFYGFI
uniref:Uncharacterized protein n=1 Tax=Meloidogyne javanica TaxID=6303 RepID=A0A915M1U6_MELJA